MKKWELLEQKYADSEAIEVQVSRAVKGGLIAFYEGISGFIPASHVSARYVTDLEQFKDRIFKVKLLDFDKRKRRIIFSRKKICKKELNQLKKDFWENIEINSIIKGTVQRLTNFEIGRAHV